MSNLSTFQTLPLHIAESVAHYCMSGYRTFQCHVKPEERSRLAWRVFYDVSNLWRVLALRFYCKTLYVTMRPGPYKKPSFVGLPPSIEVQKHFYNYVKALILVIGDLALEPYTVIAERYDELWPEGIVLTAASQATIYLALNRVNCTTADNQVENEKLFRLLQRIRISMPRLREVRMNNSCKKKAYKPNHLANTTEPKLDSLFVDILKRWSKVEAHAWPSLLDGRDAMLLNGSLITSLSFTVNKDMELFSIVLQRIGPTLVSLDINSFHPRSIEALVFDSGGNPIVYSQLKKLSFHAHPILLHADFARLNLTASPFPNLRYLKWVSEYPFEKDVLFQGSYDILEYLHVTFYRSTLYMLERHDAALRNRYTRLRHLSVRVDPDLADAEIGCDPLLKLSASLVSSETQTVEMDGDYSWKQVFDTFSTCPHVENIRVLSLGGTALRLFQMLKLIKMLPNMTDFACCFSGRGADTHKKDGRTVVERLYPEYYPLSQRLRCWEVKKGLVQTAQVAIVAITLAVLCPNFTFVAMQPEDIHAFQISLEVKIESRDYYCYLDDVKCLFTKKQEEYIINGY